MIRKLSIAGLLACFAAQPAVAEEFQTITDKRSFLSVLEGRKLTRLGIRLDVRPTGEIEGSAFGKDVTGAWRWQGGYFCRDLNFGQQDLGPNCQVVKVKGKTVRFIADKGAGDYADLSLR